MQDQFRDVQVSTTAGDQAFHTEIFALMDSQNFSKPSSISDVKPPTVLSELQIAGDEFVNSAKPEMKEYSIPDSAKQFIVDDLKDGVLGRGTQLLFKEIFDATANRQGLSVINKLIDEINERQAQFGTIIRLCIDQDLVNPKGQANWNETIKLTLKIGDEDRGRLSSVVIHQEPVSNPWTWKPRK